MDRRRFIGSGLVAASSLYLSGENAPAQESNSKELTAGDVHNYLRSLGTGWVDPKRTVDTFKAGSPDMPVTGIAVGWMSYFDSLRRAVELDCNLFVTHEPTYYDHLDKDKSVFEFETARKKKEFIETHNLSVIRCHDVWDQYPRLGIPDSWGSFLGLKNCVLTRDFYRVYELPAASAAHLARHVDTRGPGCGSCRRRDPGVGRGRDARPVTGPARENRRPRLLRGLDAGVPPRRPRADGLPRPAPRADL